MNGNNKQQTMTNRSSPGDGATAGDPPGSPARRDVHKKGTREHSPPGTPKIDRVERENSTKKQPIGSTPQRKSSEEEEEPWTKVGNADDPRIVPLPPDESSPVKTGGYYDGLPVDDDEDEQTDPAKVLFHPGEDLEPNAETKEERKEEEIKETRKAEETPETAGVDEGKTLPKEVQSEEDDPEPKEDAGRNLAEEKRGKGAEDGGDDPNVNETKETKDVEGAEKVKTKGGKPDPILEDPEKVEPTKGASNVPNETTPKQIDPPKPKKKKGKSKKRADKPDSMIVDEEEARLIEEAISANKAVEDAAIFELSLDGYMEDGEDNVDPHMVFTREDLDSTMSLGTSGAAAQVMAHLRTREE